MTVRRSKFTPPQITKQRSPRRMRQEMFEPIRGLNTAVPPQNVRPGQTPLSQNFVVDDNTLTPRSGLSQWGTSGLGVEKALGAFKADDVLGTTYYLISSDQTSSVKTNDASNWAQLTGTPDSSASTAYYDYAAGYFPSLDENGIIQCNGLDAPMYFPFLATGWSALGDFGSHESFAKYTTFFDNRAVMFNVGSRTTLPYATRVRWSKRGNPLEWTDQDAGFEDLVDMRGEGTGIYGEEDRMVLFSEEETWIGRQRRDQYAFEFFPLNREVGNPHPRSAAVTDKGIIWLDREYRFRMVAGNAVYTFNDSTQKFLKDTLREPDEVWSTYDPEQGLYKMQFSSVTGEYPDRGLWLKTETIVADEANPNVLSGTWMPQRFSGDSLSAGVEELTVSSLGTAYRLSSGQTNDAGIDIDARWRSHAMRLQKDPDPKESITGSWLDYQATEASNVSLLYSGDLGGSFTDVGTSFSLTSGNGTAFLPFTTPANRFQMIEMRVGDGSKPRLVNLRLELRQYTGKF